MGAPSSELQVVVTTGIEDTERVEFALQAALVAACSNIKVIVFLTLRGSVWACDNPPAEEHAGINELMDQLLSQGATIECCTRCAEAACGDEAQPPYHDNIRPGVLQSGLVTFAARAARGVPTVTF